VVRSPYTRIARIVELLWGVVVRHLLPGERLLARAVVRLQVRVQQQQQEKEVRRQGQQGVGQMGPCTRV